MYALSWQEVQSSGSNALPVFIRLSGMSMVLVMTALDQIDRDKDWFGATGDLTAVELDEVDAAVSLAKSEVLTNMFIGAVVPYIGAVEPSWGVFADGRTLAKADYPQLWEVSDNRTATDFTLPDLRDRFLVGAGFSHALGATGGSAEVTLTEAQIPPHSHSYQGVIPNVDLESPGVPDIVAAGINPLPQQTGLTGGGQAHPNEPQYGTVNYVAITPKP